MRQLYWICYDVAHPAPRPANFVMQATNTDKLAGFVAEVDPGANRMLVCLFEPDEAPSDYPVQVVSEKVDRAEVQSRLVVALKANPNMCLEWSIEFARRASN